MSDGMSEVSVLDKLFATSTITPPGFGREVVIKKATLRSLQPILTVLHRVLEDLKVTTDMLPSVDVQDPSLILKLISKYYDDVVSLAVAHSSVTQDELLDMDLDDSVLIVQAVAALNKDFFTKKVLPNLKLLSAG